MRIIALRDSSAEITRDARLSIMYWEKRKKKKKKEKKRDGSENEGWRETRREHIEHPARSSEMRGFRLEHEMNT